MHAKNFYSEFLDIFKNNFRSANAYASMSQSGFLVFLSALFTFQVVVLVPQSSVKIIELQTMILARSLCSRGEVVDAKAPGVLFTTMLLNQTSELR
jgi:hypothetical protein